MRDVATKKRRLSLAGRKPKISSPKYSTSMWLWNCINPLHHRQMCMVSTIFLWLYKMKIYRYNLKCTSTECLDHSEIFFYSCLTYFLMQLCSYCVKINVFELNHVTWATRPYPGRVYELLAEPGCGVASGTSVTTLCTLPTSNLQ